MFKWRDKNDNQRKRQKIKEHCNSMKACAYCKLCDVELNCFNVVKYGSDEEVEKLYNILTYGTEAVTRNIAEVSYTFICKQCGAHLEDCVKAVYTDIDDVDDDEGAKDIVYSEYEFKFCPECGRKVVEE